jgi:hypothetical protein
MQSLTCHTKQHQIFSRNICCAIAVQLQSTLNCQVGNTQ